VKFNTIYMIWYDMVFWNSIQTYLYIIYIIYLILHIIYKYNI
jgi:hypothetical protein